MIVAVRSAGALPRSSCSLDRERQQPTAADPVEGRYDRRGGVRHEQRRTNMRYLSLGNSGLGVSVVGLGCKNFGGRLELAGTRPAGGAAIDAGITLFDTADIYGGGGGSEELLGEVLTGRRDQVVLATKFGHQHADMGYGHAAGAKGGRAYIRRAVEQSLRRLRTDYIDLYQIHTPDPRTPIAETLAALNELVAEGKVRYLGHSNFTAWQLPQAPSVPERHATVPF